MKICRKIKKLCTGIFYENFEKFYNFKKNYKKLKSGITD